MNATCRHAVHGLLLTLAVLHAAPTAAETHHVRTSADFMGLPVLKAGDRVIVHDGRYADVVKEITGEGTAERPVLVYAQTLGGAAFAGATHVSILGSHVTFAGFRFDGETAPGGPQRKGGTLRLGRDSRRCRVTNTMFRAFNEGSVRESHWLVVEGYEHAIEYNSFEGKTSAGPTVVFSLAEGPETRTTPRGHVFRYNYMGARVDIGGNGFEGLRVGVSGHQEYELRSTFEYNYFFRTIDFPEGQNGEQEVVSNKSSGNTYRYNTFERMKGELSLRHGDDCIVEGNFFLQDGTPRSGGVRVIGERHVVRNNYFQGVTGTAILVYSGDRNWPATEVSTGHEAGDAARVEANTIVDSETGIVVGGGSERRRPAERVEVRGNLVQARAGAVGYRLASDAPKLAVSGNVLHQPGDDVPSAGGVSRAASPVLVREGPGLYRRVSGVEAGAEPPPSTGPRLPVGRADVGPSYYGGPADTFVPAP